MTLDSKDSDIEQLRSQLQALHMGMDSSSTGSGPGDAEADDGFPGTTNLFAALSLFLLKAFCLKYKPVNYLNPVTGFVLEEKCSSFFSGRTSLE